MQSETRSIRNAGEVHIYMYKIYGNYEGVKAMTPVPGSHLAKNHVRKPRPGNSVGHIPYVHALKQEIQPELELGASCAHDVFYR